MRGLDGNYLNAQGDALSRMQTVYQSEQARQQVQAQLGAQDALRKLREQVNEPEGAGDAHGPRTVGEDPGPGKGWAGNESQERKGDMDKERPREPGKMAPGRVSHIDIRV